MDTTQPTQHKQPLYFVALFFLLLALCGVADTSYLTYDHYTNTTGICVVPSGIPLWLANCGKVTQSVYASFFGVPLALIGLFYYLTLFGIAIWFWKKRTLRALMFGALLSGIGFLFSLYFVFLQIAIIEAICLYCMFSVLISTTLFGTLATAFERFRRRISSPNQ